MAFCLLKVLLPRKQSVFTSSSLVLQLVWWPSQVQDPHWYWRKPYFRAPKVSIFFSTKCSDVFEQIFFSLPYYPYCSHYVRKSMGRCDVQNHFHQCPFRNILSLPLYALMNSKQLYWVMHGTLLASLSINQFN